MSNKNNAILSSITTARFRGKLLIRVPLILVNVKIAIVMVLCFLSHNYLYHLLISIFILIDELLDPQ